MIPQERRPELRGKKRSSTLLMWGMIPVIGSGIIRVGIHIDERFSVSPEKGIEALNFFVFVTTGIVVFAAAAGYFLEYWMHRQARQASGTGALIPICLGLDSYQQAYDLAGSVIFSPIRHEGGYLVVRQDCVEIYTGYKSYSGPLFRVPFSQVNSLSRKVVTLPVGKEPGIVFHCTNGLFEVGFTRAAAFRMRKTTSASADAAYREVSDAFLTWLDDSQKG